MAAHMGRSRRRVSTPSAPGAHNFSPALSRLSVRHFIHSTYYSYLSLVAADAVSRVCRRRQCCASGTVCYSRVPRCSYEPRSRSARMWLLYSRLLTSVYLLGAIYRMRLRTSLGNCWRWRARTCYTARWAPWRRRCSTTRCSPRPAHQGAALPCPLPVRPTHQHQHQQQQYSTTRALDLPFTLEHLRFRTL